MGIAFQADPARPAQTLELAGILGSNTPRLITERNTLLFDGISSHTVDSGGSARIERMITTFQTNALGSPDTSFLDVNTLYTLSFFRFDFRTRFANKFPRHKLAGDGNRFGPGQPVVTPKIAKAEAVTIFRGWEDLALAENVDQFKRDLVVERDKSNVNRLNFLLPPDLVNQLRLTAAQIQFLL